MAEKISLSQKLKFIQSLSERIMDVESSQSITPELSPVFLYINAELIKQQNENVTVFDGGSLRLKEFGIDKAWLTPIEIEDDQGFSNFHIIYLNCLPEDDLTDVTVELNLVDERQLRLNQTTNQAQEFNKIFTQNDGQKRIIIRPSITGSFAYPKITTPLDTPSSEILTSRLKKLVSHNKFNLEIDEDIVKAFVEDQEFNLFAEFESFVMGEEKTIETEMGKVYVTQIYAYEDPWQYYEIYSHRSLKDQRQLAQEKVPLTIRVDSGCDIGMMYHDGGCDCHKQLLMALAETKETPGFVVHIPTQDGRGYGMNTKMETESMKNSTPSKFNPSGEEFDTNRAAKSLFLNTNHDVRTFDTISKILSELGIRNINLTTDNIKKVEQLTSSPHVKIKRKETNTLESCSEHQKLHVQSKHNTEMYIS